jgi:hypothetical protein
MDVLRCLATNNPVGTDTRPVGQPCSCDVCKLDRKLNDAVLEVDRLVRINKSFGAEIKRLRKLKGEPDNWSPTLDKGDE